MKKIINGRLYDTEKADVVTASVVTVDRSKEFREILYRTKKNRYFLYKNLAGIEILKPMTDDEAYNYLCEHDPDEAIKNFPWKEVEEA